MKCKATLKHTGNDLVTLEMDYVYVGKPTTSEDPILFGFNKTGEIYVRTKQVAYDKEVAELLIEHFEKNK
jgi:hypothetical protein